MRLKYADVVLEEDHRKWLLEQIRQTVGHAESKGMFCSEFILGSLLAIAGMPVDEMEALTEGLNQELTHSLNRAVADAIRDPAFLERIVKVVKDSTEKGD